MARITGVFDSFEHAFRRRTLDLFRSEHARFCLALFKVVFPDVSEPLPSAEARARIDRCIAEMVADGYEERMLREDGRPKTSRAICREMIDRYRQRCIAVESLLKDMRAYERFEPFGTDMATGKTALSARVEKPLEHLADEERAVYRLITSPYCTGHRRIEQERIPFPEPETARFALAAMQG